MTKQTEPMIKAMREASRTHKASPQGKLESLLAEERKWKRRRTIAENKLAEVREDINRLALEHTAMLNGLPEVWGSVERKV